MSDEIGHYCGIALLRLRKPLQHFSERYGDPVWGLRQLYLLMEKQHNRGQDGAGVAVCRFNMPPGEAFLKRIRTDKRNPVERVFDILLRDARTADFETLCTLDDEALKRRLEFVGEVLIGHLRYGTHSGRSLANCHPYVRKNIVASRTLALAGNFNMTNSPALFEKLVSYGLNPVGDSDTQVIIEKIGYALDQEHEHLARSMGPGSFLGLEGIDLATTISRELDIARILSRASTDFDGGYAFAGVLGNGDSFVLRDPAGIRPVYHLVHDDFVAVASERAALVTVFNVDPETIQPVRPGHVLVMKRGGELTHVPFCDPRPTRQCTFERIYFSRGNDASIYQQRKALGRNLAGRVHDALDSDLDRAVFSFVPNTAEPAYLGLLEELEHLSRKRQADVLWQRYQDRTLERDDLDALLNGRPRMEKVAHKDQKLRTFITHDEARRSLVSHVYDITRGTLGPDDTLVVVDDSIVRGTTMRESIITMLSRLKPKRILVVSSAPPIMYPDCYGIDMSQLGRFIAFEAAIALLEEHDRQDVLADVDKRCAQQADRADHRLENHVRRLYEPFSLDELSAKISALVRPRSTAWDGRLDILYQSIDGLRDAMGPEFTGDWYFTGDYPTPGGYRVLNQAYLNWRTGDVMSRSY